MRRGFRRSLYWRRGLWVREAPGRRGLLLSILGPLAFFLPLDALGIVGSRVQSISLMVWVMAISLPLSVRGGSSPRDSSGIWLFQKGCPPAETALEDWVLDVALFSTALTWWALTGVSILAFSYPVTLLNILALWGLGFSVALLTHATSFLLSALGARRTTDPVVFLAFMSVLLPPLTTNSPGWFSGAVDWVLPPYHSTLLLSGALRRGDPTETSGALFHVLLYSGAALWLGLARVARWRPTR